MEDARENEGKQSTAARTNQRHQSGEVGDADNYQSTEYH